VLRVGFLLVRAFGRHHNNRQKIVHNRKSTGNISYQDYSKILLIGEEMVEL